MFDDETLLKEQARLRSEAMKKKLNQQDAEDLVNDTFLILLGRTFKSLLDFKKLATRVLHNKIIDLARKRHFRKETSLESPSLKGNPQLKLDMGELDEKIELEQRRQIVAEILPTLKPAEQHLWRMMEAGMEPADIARVRGISQENARQRCKYLRDKVTKLAQARIEEIRRTAAKNQGNALDGSKEDPEPQ
jgi:RNA polymerase sigma factor (sigma-70 family)